MKKYKSEFVLVAAFVLLGLWMGCSKTSEKPSGKKQIYTCSMHPQIRQDHPGDCPICGMALVPVRENNEKESTGSEVQSSEVHLQSNQIQNAGVRSSTVEKKKLRDQIHVFGTMAYVADNHLDLTSFYSGRIERVLIPYNTTEVKKGTPLLEIYSEEAIQDQEKYLEALRSRYLSTFYERRLMTSQIETVRARLLKAGFTEGDLEDLEKKGKVKTLVVVRAMRSGSIVGSLPHAGERIAQESIIFHIAPLDRLWFVGQVFEKDIASVRVGQSAEVESPSQPGKTYPGRVVFLDQVLEPETRTRMIRVEVENKNRDLLPQMSGNAKLDGATREVLAIPSTAVIETGMRSVVYVEKSENVFEAQEVKILEKGKSEDGASWVSLEGLKEGVKVAVEGAFLLDAEAQIRNPQMHSSSEK